MLQDAQVRKIAVGGLSKDWIENSVEGGSSRR